MTKRERESDKIINEWKVPMPTTFLEMLTWGEISDDNDNKIVMFFESIYEITLKAIKNETRKHKEVTIDVCSELWNLYTRIREFRFTHKKQLSAYTLVGNFEGFCIDTLAFLCECNIIGILEANFPEKLEIHLLTELDYEFLLKNRLLMISPKEKKVHDYTQTDVILSLYNIAQLWQKSELIPQVKKFVFTIAHRVSRYIIYHDANFVDGIGKQILHINDSTVIPSKEFFSDVSVLVSSLTIGFFSLEIFGKTRVHTMYGQIICEGYNIVNVYANLMLDLKEKNKYGNKEIYTKLVKKLTNYLYLRPGEEERFAREKFGIYTKDPSEVMELFRTQYQLFIHSNTTNELLNNVPDTISMTEGPYKLDNDKGILTHIKVGVFIKLFDYFCVAECNFNWIENCLVLERDISASYMKIHIATYPIVIQMGGEFNVLFGKDLYRSKSSEIAISVWLIIISSRLEGIIWVDGTKYNLSKIKQKIDTWKSAKKITSIWEQEENSNSTSDILI